METMTVKEALEATIRILEAISIPVTQIQDIGIPVARSISNLKACVDVYARQEQEKAEEEKPEN